jgi:hypothetical protein
MLAPGTFDGYKGLCIQQFLSRTWSGTRRSGASMKRLWTFDIFDDKFRDGVSRGILSGKEVISFLLCVMEMFLKFASAFGGVRSGAILFGDGMKEYKCLAPATSAWLIRLHNYELQSQSTHRSRFVNCNFDLTVSVPQSAWVTRWLILVRIVLRHNFLHTISTFRRTA